MKILCLHSRLDGYKFASKKAVNIENFMKVTCFSLKKSVLLRFQKYGLGDKMSFTYFVTLLWKNGDFVTGNGNFFASNFCNNEGLG